MTHTNAKAERPPLYTADDFYRAGHRSVEDPSSEPPKFPTPHDRMEFAQGRADAAHDRALAAHDGDMVAVRQDPGWIEAEREEVKARAALRASQDERMCHMFTTADPIEEKLTEIAVAEASGSRFRPSSGNAPSWDAFVARKRRGSGWPVPDRTFALEKRPAAPVLPLDVFDGWAD